MFLMMSHRRVTRVYVIVHEFRQWWWSKLSC